MRHFFRFIFIILFTVAANISNAAVGSFYNTELYRFGNETFQTNEAPDAISATITGTTTVCQNESNPVITFTGSGGTPPYTFTYTINNGANTPIKTTSGNSVNLVVPGAAGTYIYNLKSVSDDLDAPVTQIGTATVSINSSPVIDFSFSSSGNLCASTAVQFTSTVTSPNPVTYKWDFGDSSTSTDQNPSHLFTVSPGVGTQTLNVKLVVTNTVTNCTATITKSITLSQSPDATMNGTGSGGFLNGVPVFETCSNAGSVYTFTNSSSTKDSNVNYTISWGDGSADFVASSWTTITHTYKIGSWNLVYTIEGSNGCIIAKPYIVFVGATPTVTLGKPANMSICNPGTLSFTLSGTRNNPPGTTYTVTYSDGSEPEVYNHPPPSEVTHTFKKTSCGTTSSSYPNSFSASVVAENPCGKYESVVAPIYVSDPPVADFNLPATVSCINSQVCLTNTTTEGLIASSGGCLNPTLIWSISPATGYTLASGSLGSDLGSTDQTLWTTGSNSICPVFSAPGTYIVTLKAGNNCGSSRINKTICVEAPLSPKFTLDVNAGCTPLAVSATNTTVVKDSCTAPVYKWDVSYSSGNCGTTSVYTYTKQTSSSSYNPSFEFTNSGIYTITLSATNSCGTQINSQTVVVKKTPTVTINDIPDFCGSASIKPTAVINSCAPITNFAWSFPGGIPATAATEIPGTITYSAPGHYEVSLTLSSECGTSIIATKTFTVDTVPVLTNKAMSQTICSGQQTELITLTSDAPGTTYSWSATATAGVSGFTTSGTTNIIPVQTLATSSDQAGIVTYSITPKLGECTGIVSTYLVTVNPIAIFTGQPASSNVCQNGTPVPLSVSYTNVASAPMYQWYRNLADNNISGTSIAGATGSTYDPPTGTLGTVYYYCIVSFASGACSNITSNSANITVTTPPTISTQPIVTQNICVGGTIATPLSANYTGGAGTPTYQWYSNDKNSNAGGTLISGATNAGYTPPAFASAGKYYYYVMLTLSGSNCGSVFSNPSEIIVYDDPIVSIQPLSTQSVCQGAAPTDLKLTATGGLGKYLYQWYSNSTNNTTSGSLIPGATTDTYKPSTSSVGTNYYYCKITQEGGLGCDATSIPAQVIIIPAPTFSAQPLSFAVCQNGTPKTLTVAYINGSGIPAYQWYSNTVENITTGNKIGGATLPTYDPPTSVIDTIYYYCIVTLPTGTCSTLISEAAMVAVNAVPLIKTQPTFTQDICVGGTIATPLSVEYTGGAGIVSYQWYSNTTNSNLTGTAISGATGSTYTPPAFTSVGINYFYYVVTFSGSGCNTLLSNTAEINVVPDPVVTSQPIGNQTLCQSSVPLTLTVAVSGGIGGYSYQWYRNTVNNTNSGTLIEGATFATYIPLTSTIGTNYYYCHITQPAGIGCDATSNTSEVVVVATPTFATQPASSIICEGETPAVLSVTYTGGVGVPTYKWYSNVDNNTTTGVVIPGATTALYNPSATVGKTTYYYCVITFSSGGCTNLTSSVAQVTVNANPLIAPKSLEICSGDTFSVIPNNLSGDIVPTGTTYIWSKPTISSPGSITGTSAQSKPQTAISQILINNSSSLATATYTVTPISGVCAGPDFNVIVTVKPAININSTVNNISCFGDDNGTIVVNITGGVPFSSGSPYTITWTGPNGFTSASMNLTGLLAGVYNLSITDAGSCPVTRSYTIIEPSPIVLNTDTENDIQCYGANNGGIAITVTGGTTPYNYAWTKDGVSFAKTEDLSNIGPGVYEVTVSDVNNCTKKTASFTITEPPAFLVTGKIDHIINTTVPNSGAITLTASGGTPPYTYNWSNGATTKDLNNIPAGKYIVNVTDTKGCVQMVQFDVLKQTPVVISVDVKNDYDCLAQEPVKVCTAFISGGIPPFMITWNRGNISGTNNEIMTTNQNGSVTVTAVDSYGLTASYTFNIQTTVGFDYSIVDCRQYLSQFNALDAGVTGQNYTYLWDFGDGKTDSLKNVQHAYSTYGTYHVKLIIKSTMCTSNYEKTISFEPLPKLSLGNDIKLCLGDSVVQRISNAVTHVWSDGSTADNFLIKKKGDYSVICTSGDGCLDTLRFTVTCDLYNYTISTDREELTLDGKPLTLWSDYYEFSKYYWDFGDGSTGEGVEVEHPFVPVKEGYFDVKLKVINPNGCPEYASKRIWIVNNSEANTFTPNGDGINDRFMPGWNLKIYNRNGILLYEGNDGWDGKYKGKLVSQDTYFYVMDYASETGTKFKEGYVMVIR